MSAVQARQIGIVGLGLVGKAVAARLLDGGYRVTGCDIDPACRSDAARMGVNIAATLRELADQSEILLLSLPDADAVATVLWGEYGLAAACPPHAIILDATTTRPQDTVAHHERLAAQSIRYIDTPLVGSSELVAAGEAVALVGDTEARADYTDVLAAFTTRVFFFDAPGRGHAAKLVINLVLGLNRLALCEGLALARKCGMDLTLMLDALANSAAYSKAMDTKGPRILDEDWRPVARLAQHAKDVDLILEFAAAHGARAPVSALHAALLREAVDKGWGALDNIAVFRVFE